MKGLFKYLLLLIFAGVAPPATAALWQWSTTPASNTLADPSVNWAIGMAPSAVGPSMRAMMARMAEYRDDISGALLTTGSATSYVVTSNQANGGVGVCGTGTTPTNGQMIVITPHVGNGAAPILAVDGCTAFNICSVAGTNVSAGRLAALTPYNLKYDNGTTCWVLHNFYGNPFALPLGGLMAYTGTVAPSANYVLPAGQCLSTTTYAAYWTLLGSPGVGGCAAGNFPIIDLRGRILSALDNLNGSAASLMTSVATGCGTAFTSIGTLCANAAESLTLSVTQTPTGITFAATQSISVVGNAGQNVLFDGGMEPGGTLGGVSQPFAGGYSSGYSMTTSNSISATESGGGGARPKVQSTIAVTYLLRVL